MERSRSTPHNPAPARRLGYIQRSSVYKRRQTQVPSKTIQDISAKSVPKPIKLATSSFPKPQPSLARNTTKFVQDVIPAQRPRLTVQLPTQTVAEFQRNIAVPKKQRSWLRFKRQAAKTARPKNRQTKLLYAMAAVIFVVGLTISLNGLLTNRKVAAQVKQLSNQTQTTGSHSSAPPATTKPSETDIANYVVAPNLPRYIDIHALGVHARVLSLGVNSKNELQAPGNVYDAGWYNASAQPGQAGAMLVDGHISSWTTQGVFYGLNKLVAGDTITVTRGDNKTFTYTVIKTQTSDATSVDMASLLVSQDTTRPGLNLISCSGDVIPGTNEFNKRIVIYAVLE